ncbi:MAG: nitroreductase/quinone reductase family protein [Candidatus Promineifilaceae bacterium]|nr:nitroreductase/quinone reductase family protein [Candidatus Promineifilaceae bacterium]
MSVRKVSDNRPPQLLFKLGNPIVKAILASPIHGLLDGGLMLLTFVGRISGKSYTIPVGYHTQDDNSLLVFSGHSWWKNLRGGKKVKLLLRGKAVEAMAEPITEREVVMAHVNQFVAENGIDNVRRIGVFLQNKNPSAEELAEGAKNTVIIRLTPLQ